MKQIIKIETREDKEKSYKVKTNLGILNIAKSKKEVPSLEVGKEYDAVIVEQTYNNRLMKWINEATPIIQQSIGTINNKQTANESLINMIKSYSKDIIVALINKEIIKNMTEIETFYTELMDLMAFYEPTEERVGD